MSMQDRPARPARTKPVPTADAGVDPVDFRPQAPTPDKAGTDEQQPETSTTTLPEPAPLTPRRNVSLPRTNAPDLSEPLAGVGPQATVQLGVNVHPDIAQLVAHIKRTTGLSKRAIVEKALLNTWGDSK